MHEKNKSVEVVGVRVDNFTMDQLVDQLLDWTTLPGLHIAVGVNAHVCNLAAKDQAFRDLVQASDLNYADGQSVVWAGRLLGGDVGERIATTDLVFPLVQQCAAHSKRIFLFGGKPGVAELAAARLQKFAPGLQCSTSDGYVSKENMPALIDKINNFGTDVLLVGLGDPLQQEWVANSRGQLLVPVALTCGGLFDWTSGHNKRAPRWMIAAGLEWLWRLALEPRRLAKRYVVGNPAFVFRLVKQILSKKFQD
ncbi:glycosyltransferase [Nakamurella antarctica]|uniref:Glycosyltransferase n=1 Tax=Nakamurella antarctica TaxID=1902245 RepID=A0A3G8ZJA4_9ACTN|nr:WecB/TagA/CpsF family glycosyltransferase [Nakamurella antarctica]AZI57353.1 glycosyltransferase [Nakamurella antarctica]